MRRPPPFAGGLHATIAREQAALLPRSSGPRPPLPRTEPLPLDRATHAGSPLRNGGAGALPGAPAAQPRAAVGRDAVPAHTPEEEAETCPRRAAFRVPRRSG